MDALQTMKDMMVLPTTEVAERINQMPAQMFFEGARALYNYFDSEFKDLKAKRKEQLKGLDMIMETAQHIIMKDENNLTPEDRMIFFNAMKEASDKRNAIFEESKGEENLIKWVKRGTVTAGVATVFGLAIAYMFKKK